MNLRDEKLDRDDVAIVIRSFANIAKNLRNLFKACVDRGDVDRVDVDQDDVNRDDVDQDDVLAIHAPHQ